MENTPLAHPMLIVMPNRVTTLRISTLREAVECLMYQWPEVHGQHHVEALSAFTKALQGVDSVARAEEAFAAAAAEAQLIVQRIQSR